MNCFRLLGRLWILFLIIPTRLDAVCTSYPVGNDRKQWSDIENHKVAKSLNPLIKDVQSIRGRGHGKINYDVYAITVDSQGDSPEKFFNYIRKNISSIIFSGTSYSLAPYNKKNEKKWNSKKSKGAVMSFTLAKIPGVMDLERGSVVLSCISPTDMIFSTVTTSKDGWHPVAGNRAFGVIRAQNGGLTFFVKAADRVVNKGFFAVLPEKGREFIYKQGHNVWMRMLDNIEKKMKTRKPRSRFVHSVRMDY